MKTGLQAPLLKAVPYTHSVLRSIVHAGDCVVDATMGNGHDTTFLAGLVGPSGKVFAFDVQQQALERTQERLREAGEGHQVQLFHQCHSRMQTALPQEVHGQIRAVVFNLGYLPGANKDLTTHRETTIQAVDAALNVLSEQGVLIVVVYPGHAEGREEGEVLERHLQCLDQNNYQVAKYGFLNLRNSPPYVLAVIKSGPT